MSQIAEGVFGSLSFALTKDMFGSSKSFFDNILADERGVRLSYGLFSHERRVGFDLLYPNAANNEEEHADKLDQAGPITKRIMKGFNGEAEPNHLFPETVGLYLHQMYENELKEMFSITEQKEGKRKKPDLLLQYRNQSTIDKLDFDFGFNLAYNHFRS